MDGSHVSTDQQIDLGVTDTRILNAFKEQCDLVGLPYDPAGLVRHHRGNAGVAAGAEAFVGVLRAERERDAAQAEAAILRGELMVTVTAVLALASKWDQGDIPDWPPAMADDLRQAVLGEHLTQFSTTQGGDPQVQLTLALLVAARANQDRTRVEAQLQTLQDQLQDALEAARAEAAEVDERGQALSESLDREAIGSTEFAELRGRVLALAEHYDKSGAPQELGEEIRAAVWGQDWAGANPTQSSHCPECGAALIGRPRACARHGETGPEAASIVATAQRMHLGCACGGWTLHLKEARREVRGQSE
jgi:hypothetical protein